ncbi:tRNA 2-selenouridine(34) synthase MnmH [Burkholderia alba]|uniref:tRNA 2-selenouridine(34) synthase MnmH n=1 Tax=Burkholderia alba TaxID=2683677 RepID=UPI002B0618AC|nr:tRNA 2-selenouridine(34) synthase MnmH [Burkholderia alba]
MNPQLASLDQLSEFDEIVDVRTPLEYAEDHIPGALNAPVLDNEERAIVGTMYKQVSPHEATRVGAAMVARNIARHLDTLFADRPLNWRPLIYCWRGGARSKSMTSWFNLIGWRARQLEGGYKHYRRSIVAALDTLPPAFRFIVLAGPTGSGKTRLIGALAAAGAQTLDLEGLAAHRGSVLGALPDAPQPSQKAFDTALVGALRAFDPARPVFVEAESRRIGSITLPSAVLAGMRDTTCVNVETARTERVALLLDEYAHLFDDPASFAAQLARLTELHGRARIADWHALLDAGERRALFEALIDAHYDPAYARSSRAHLKRLLNPLRFPFRPTGDDRVEQARMLLARLNDFTG